MRSTCRHSDTGVRITGLTILIPTFNRAAVLRKTLAAVADLHYPVADCEIVVIDNASTDDTPAVVKSFQSRAPISNLLERRVGKNAALNRALRECTLKDLVVFTDDDVTPERDWLQQIVRVSARHADVAVFGGRVDVEWPDNRRPEWAEAAWIQAFAYSHHDLGESEMFYTGTACPFGPNFWVRREAFAAVPLYNEELGPRPSKRLIGGETEFLLKLRSRGFQALYAPSVKVTHRIASHECRVPALRRRAYAFGRGQVRLHGCLRQDVYRRNRWLWASMMPLDYLYASLRLMTGFMRRTPRRRCEATVQAMVRLGSLNESMALFRKTWLAPRARLPNLSSSLNVGRLRYIQSLHEPPSQRNPDTLVKRFFPLGERVRLRFLPKRDLAVLRSDPFYYYLVARTRHYDKVFCEAIADGVQQVLNVGCGTDTRSHRFQALIQAKQVSVMECDQLDAIHVKERLAKAWNRLTRIEYSAIDLNGGDWSSVERWLRASPGAKALVMMEGVSPYVDEDAFGRFLDVLAGALPAGSQLAYDFKFRGVDNNYGQGGAPIRPFRLPASRDDVSAFHEAHGFQLDAFDSSADLSRRLLPGIDAVPTAVFKEDGLVRLVVNRPTVTDQT